MALIACDECGRSISDRAIACPNCGAPGLGVPASRGLSRGGYEYRSKARILGMPLIHIAGGWDPVSGRRRIAKGFIAIGDIAIGVISVGGVALGGVCLGGLGLGVASIAGCSLGLLFALGGLAVGGVAIGGLAIGYYAAGGAALGVHPLGANYQDPAAIEFFNRFGGLVDQLLSKR